MKKFRLANFPLILYTTYNVKTEYCRHCDRHFVPIENNGLHTEIAERGISMKLRKLPEKRNIYLSWLKSYFVFIVLFLLVLAVMSMIVKSIMTKEINKANESTYSAIVSNVISMKNDLDKMALSIASDKQINLMIGKTGIAQAQDYLDVYNTQQVLNNYMANYNYLKEICIYNNRMDWILVNGENSGRFEADYLQQEYQFADKSIGISTSAQWREFMHQKHAREMYQMEDGDTIVVQSIPVRNFEQSVGTLIIRLRSWKLDSMVGDNIQNGTKIFVVLNDNGSLVYTSNPELSGELSPQLASRMAPGVVEQRAAGRSMIFYVSEPSVGLQCIYAIDEGEYWSDLNRVYAILFLLGILLLVLGTALAFWFSRRHYTPVQSILNLISKTQPKSVDTDDAFSYIENSLKEILKKENDRERIYNLYNNVSFQRAFVRFLARDGGRQSVSKLFEEYQIRFSGSQYLAVLVSLNDISEYFGEVDFSSSEKESELIRIAVVNVLSELLGSQYQVLSLYVDDDMLLCLFASETPLEDGAAVFFRQKAAEAQRFMKENVGIYYSAFLSAPFDSLDKVGKAYRQVTDLYAYANDLEHDVLAYDEVNWNNRVDRIPEGSERQLIECVKGGDYQSAHAIVTQFLGGNEARVNLSQHLFYFKCEIISLLRKLFLFTDEAHEQEYQALMERIEKSDTINGLRESVSALLQVLCAQYAPQEEVPLGEQVMAYVNENYHDINLNVNALGEHFRLSPGYLSKVFKMQTGEILRDYITSIRLRNVQALLITGMKLDDIAEKCGFLGANSMIRTFKNHFGITPNKYRLQLTQKD